MAMLTCAECGNEVSASAKACPQCGASRRAMRRRPREPRGKWSRVGLLAAVVLFVGLVILVGFGPKPQKTPQEAKQGRQELMRVNMAIGAAKALRVSLRNPDSLAFDKILVSEDADAVCIRYRAQNGFGGMNQELFVMTDQDTFTTAKGWRRHCAHRSLYDYTETVPEMMKLAGN